MKVTATQTTSVVNLWRKPSSNYLTGQIQGKQTILEVSKYEESVNLVHYFPYDVKLRLLAHSQSFLANQKARNAIVGAENLLNTHTLYKRILKKTSIIFVLSLYKEDLNTSLGAHLKLSSYWLFLRTVFFFFYFFIFFI